MSDKCELLRLIRKGKVSKAVRRKEPYTFWCYSLVFEETEECAKLIQFSWAGVKCFRHLFLFLHKDLGLAPRTFTNSGIGKSVPFPFPRSRIKDEISEGQDVSYASLYPESRRTIGNAAQYSLYVPYKCILWCVLICIIRYTFLKLQGASHHGAYR